MNNSILDQLNLIGLIPVVKIDDEEDALPLAQALIDGGLPCIEITFRSDAGLGALKKIAMHYPEMLVGAGTVVTLDQARQAVDAGARFIVSPGLNEKIVTFALQMNVPVLPGVVTPSDIQTAIILGLEIVKFFPAETAGGITYLKSLCGPFNKIKFVPTGGIDLSNVLDYLMMDQVWACGGSWMVKSDLIKQKKYNEIKSLAKQAVYHMLGFNLHHVGINVNDPEQALNKSRSLSDAFGFGLYEGSGSVMVGGQFELTKKPFPGDNGHLAIGTNFIERAIYFLENKGIRMKDETKIIKNGKLIAVYFDYDLNGFALHLVKK